MVSRRDALGTLIAAAPVALLAINSKVKADENTTGDIFGYANSINFAGTDVSDEHLVQISRMKTLETLVLSFTNVTDSGLQQLITLKNLRHLCLHGTDVTAEGIKWLESFLPDTNIYY